MSSEDDDFYQERASRRYETRSSSRPRRRNSNSLRRRSRRYTAIDAFDKSRRGKFWYNLSAARFVAMCIFASLVAYEVFILRAPLAADANTPSPKPRIFVSPTKVHTSISANTKSDTVSGPSANTVTPPARSIHPAPVPPAIPAQLVAPPNSAAYIAPVTSIRSRSEPVFSQRRPVTDVPADSDADGESSTKPHNLRPKFRPLMRRSRAGVTVTSDEKIVAQSPASALNIKVSSGTLPSKVSSSASALASTESDDGNAAKEKKGADPGAGENFWKWFQETKGSDNEKVATALNCPEDYQRLCSMFYKYLRKYKIRSVFDVSCTKNLDWMPDILRKAGGELWGFKYYCSAVDDQGMTDAKTKLASIPFVEFSSDQWWRSGFPNKAELLFGWDTLPHIAFGRIWNFFVKARMSDIKYILVDNYPSIQNDPVSLKARVHLPLHC